ncbi:MAG TPA: aldehyde dehydrogenase family protein [Reyranella sp.]|nr:aldehyde dehydrogenase family protein [Reyranella sp.]
MLTISNYVNGVWTKGPQIIRRNNPSTGAAFSETYIADRAIVNAAISAAQSAFREWANLPIEQRAKYIDSCADWLASQYGQQGASTEVKELISNEVGKPLPEADIELIETSGFLKYFAQQAVEVLTDRTISPDPTLWPTKTSTIIFAPVGIVGVVKAWNYPLEIPLWSIGPALLAGNTVIFKPSEKAPAVGSLIARMAEAVQLPPGVLNVVQGDADVGKLVVQHPEVRMVSFTGSVAAGRDVAKSCAERLKKVALELGGNDAALVDKDASPDLAANGLVWGAFCNAGQVCVGIKRAFVHVAIADALMERIVERTKALRLGVDVGPLIDEGQLKKVDEFVQDAVARGAKLLVGGRRGEAGQGGTFYHPTVLTGVTNEMRLFNEECFGPILPIRIVEDMNEAVAAANESKFGLGASIWTSDLASGSALARRVSVGMAWVNDVNVAFAETPWGGVKESGLGFELSPDALYEYTVRRHISLETGGDTRRAWWYPY